MSYAVLAASVAIQLAGATVGWLLGWTRMRLAWFLMATAITLMAIRRAISLYGSLSTGRELDLAAEWTALLISTLMLLALLLLFLKSAEKEPDHRQPDDSRGWNPGMIACLLGICIVLATCFVAYSAFRESKRAVVEGIVESNQRMAKSLALIADSFQGAVSSEERVRLLEDIWNNNPEAAGHGGYVCIVDAQGNLLAHTAAPQTQGNYVGENVLKDPQHRYRNLKELVDARTDWGGWYISSAGQSQIAAFSYSPSLSSLVAVHVSEETVQREVLRVAFPLAAGLLLILILLLPTALGVLYRAYARALRAVQDSESRYRVVLETQSELLCRFHPGGVLTFVNEPYCRFFRRDPESLVGHSFLPLVPVEDRVRIQTQLQSLTADNPEASQEHRMLTSDGQVRWMRWTTRGVFDTSGEMIEVQASGADITESKLARDKIERFARIFEESLNEIYLFRADTLEYIQANHAALRNLGYTLEELQTLTPIDITPQLSLESYRPMLDGLRRGQKEQLDFETVHRRKDGSEYVVEVHLQHLEDEQPVYVAIVLDITERKRAQEQKAEVDARSSAIIENAAEGILTIDGQCRIESVNPAALELFGYARMDILGRNIHMLVPEFRPVQTSGCEGCAISAGLTAASAPEGELTGVRKDGSTFPLRLSASEVSFGDKRLLTAIVSDLTRERELEQQLLRAQKLDALGTLAGGIAHDFNNVIQAMMGNCTLARENVGANSGVVAECLEQIEACSGRAADMVEQILAFSRRSDAAQQPVLLQSVVGEALRFLRKSVPTTIAFTVDLDEACGPVLANATQIHQMFTNLCTNAMHAMEVGGGELSVTLRPYELRHQRHTLSGEIAPGDYVALNVSDTGTGVPPELLPKLVDPFFTTKGPGKGTGLGLAMVHGIVKRAHGGLVIESKYGEGTRVSVLFPRTEQAVAAPDDGPGESREAGRGRILLVDDEKMVTDVVRKVLSSRGYAVEAYNDVDEALAGIAGDGAAFDLAILDYTMPRKTGLELARDLYRINPGLPVLLASGDVDRTRTVERPPNVVQVLSKPIRMSYLLSILGEMMAVR